LKILLHKELSRYTEYHNRKIEKGQENNSGLQRPFMGWSRIVQYG